MKASIVFVTYNRLEYTKKTLNALLNERDQFDLYIWDNNSQDGTKEFLARDLNDSRIKEIEFYKKNVGPTKALDIFWSRCKTDLIGKVDNDCLVTPGWVKVLSDAHKSIEKLGAVACWHFRIEDFDLNTAYKKIFSYGNYKIFRHPWVCGSGFLMKRKTFLECGRLEIGKNIGLTSYFKKMASAGYINGWYYPFILQDHMDDLYSEHCLTKDTESILKNYDGTFTLRNHQIRTKEDKLRRRKEVLQTILEGPIDVNYYSEWRQRFRYIKDKIFPNSSLTRILK